MATYIIGTLIFLAFCYAICRTFFSKGKSCCGGCSGCCRSKAPSSDGETGNKHSCHCGDHHGHH